MDKTTLSERDICTKLITPALRQAGYAGFRHGGSQRDAEKIEDRWA
jgi:hypothetical protein